MARGFALSSQTRANTISFIKKIPVLPRNYQRPLFISPHRRFYPFRLPSSVSQIRLICYNSSLVQDSVDLANYEEAFSNQMAMAGLKRHHRIAIGVSGGPDSMALCFLASGWKTEGPNAVGQAGGFIDGLLAIVVDHGLRAESREEAHTVSHRVSEMGIRCEVACCSWSDGRPKQGHMLEEARDMRYEQLQNICFQHKTCVLLIAHHADDQAELFILRMSRNSGVLGLAGMASTSQLFPSRKHLHVEVPEKEGIILVRPLLQFTKKDLYKVCQMSGWDWVEDPTNRSLLYARSRIRLALENLSSCTFKSEIQAVIRTCRKTRAFVDNICIDLISQAVTIVHHGYGIIDLEILNPSKIKDLCLGKFMAVVLQFISQRQRPVRGSTSKLLLDYFRAFPCTSSLTAAGCYLCPAPGSRGTKLLVCCSVDCPQPSKAEISCIYSVGELMHFVPNELQEIIANGKSYSDRFFPDASDVQFLDSTSESVLTEAKKLNIISESTYRNILELQRDEIKHFKAKTEDNFFEPKKEIESISTSENLQPGKICYFMNRFLVTWKLCNYTLHDSWTCIIAHDKVVDVRHMVESDWLFLAKLTKCVGLDDLPYATGGTENLTEKRNPYLDYLKSSAEKALTLLKSIPFAARRSLPVLVNREGQLLSIPSIGFNNCPCLMVSCVFKPRVPLRGGHSSFL